MLELDLGTGGQGLFVIWSTAMNVSRSVPLWDAREMGTIADTKLLEMGIETMSKL